MNATPCPKCSAPLPPKGRFCLECGCDLYQAGVRRAPLAWGKSLIIFVAAVGLLAVAVLATRGRGLKRSAEMPPEERTVRDLTRDVLRLAADGRYPELVQRHYVPNAEEFRRLSETLQEIVRGRGAPGLNIFRANCMDDLEEAKKFVERLGTAHPDYVVGVLAALTFQDGALRTTLAGAPLGAQRAEDFCVWHLRLAFHSVDVKAAGIGDVRWQDGPDGKPRLVVALRYPEPPKLVPGIVDPSSLSWRLTDDGAWALAFDDGFHLDEVLAFLLKAKM